MKKFASHNLRLREIEGKRGMATIRLVFADGSTRGIQIARDYQLTLFTHACAKLRAYPPTPEGATITRPPLEPATASDQLIDLLVAAESIELGNERFLETIHGFCKALGESRAAHITDLSGGF